MPDFIRHFVVIIAACVSQLSVSPVRAHEVLHEVHSVQAMSIQLTYSDGEPFSYESYQVYVNDDDTPIQVGRTDAAGNVVFIPTGADHFRLQAFSADGHGVSLTLPNYKGPGSGPTSTVAATKGAETVEVGLSRTTRLLLGLAIILVIFAAVQIINRYRRSNTRACR